MTPPDWPAGVDYDEWLKVVAGALRSVPDDDAEGVLRRVAPLIAKAVERAEADADRLAAVLRQVSAYRMQALAAHEARKAGR